MEYQPKPAWLRRRIPAEGRGSGVTSTLRGLCLHTVCEQARCPNQGECFSRGTATFLLMGPVCTRSCTFCAVPKGKVSPVAVDETQRTAQAVAGLGLDFCVLTMVTRDDLPDGGAAQVAATIEAVREKCPGVGVEVLISDLRGDEKDLKTVLAARPEVLNHNLETVPRLYPGVRPQADYRRSLELLARAAAHSPRPAVKSGLMLGLGEEKDEVYAVMDDLRKAGCDLLTLGQYLCPSAKHHPVARYVTPKEFADYQSVAQAKGFSGVASGPYVRSSYHAKELYQKARQA